MTLPPPTTSAACSLALSVALALCPGATARAQGWDDLGFWAADFTLNALQLEAAREQLEQYQETYEVLEEGYRVVRALVNDNHDLHAEFFGDLASVSPIVADYYKVHQIYVAYRSEFAQIEATMPASIDALRETGAFTPDELAVFEGILTGMIAAMVRSIDELRVVAIDGADTEMMDSERISVVDRLYEQSQSILTDLRRFRLLILEVAEQRAPPVADHIEKLFEVAYP